MAAEFERGFFSKLLFLIPMYKKQNYITKKSHQSLVPSFDRLALVLFPKLSYLPDSLGFVAIYILAEVNLSSVFCAFYSEF